MSESNEVPLSVELDGVIADYEHDYRFDDISLATVQRVRDALARIESAEPVIWNHPPARQAMRGACPEIPGDILDHVLQTAFMAFPPLYAHPPAASADAEDAARWRYLLRNRFVLGNGTCLIDAHRTAQDAELLDAIDEARAQEGK